MPNHVSTNLYVSGESEAVKAFVVAATANGGFDFENLLPMPAELRGTSSPVRILTDEEYAAAKAKFDALPADDFMKDFGIGGITQATHDALVAKYGCADWYKWALKHWGTKWGAYDANEFTFIQNSDGSLTAKVHYETAWSPASPFYEVVSKQFPSLTFKHEFADEGGFFVGDETFQNGELTETNELQWNEGRGKELRTELGYGDVEEEEAE